jgi:hypothetical protein
MTADALLNPRVDQRDDSLPRKPQKTPVPPSARACRAQTPQSPGE